jgi:sensor histidine kinase YesM
MPPMSKNFFFILILVYLIVGLVSFISLLNHNFKATSKNKELQNKILATQLQLKEQELHYLKMQIHPHFLFNTLNTIYGFALKQSKQTPEIILKLSNLLDYILYQVDKPGVSLMEDIMHIREYIELEKVRFQDTLNVTMKIQEFNRDVEIAPMLLLPFVENAFKHGDLVEGYLSVFISISLQNERLEFNIKNSAFAHENGKGGIGLENIRKRLELHYKDRYRLKHELIDNWYIVDLSIFDLKAVEHA